MNARISREFAFQAAIHFENNFIINSYGLTLFMDVTTENIREQNIALERIKYLIHECFENCLFIDISNKTAIENYLKAGIRVCTLPDEPYDQVVAAVLLSKFNAVTEKKLVISEIKINSVICDEVSFYITPDENFDFYTNSETWWTESSPTITECRKKPTKKEKIVELTKELTDWTTLDMGWKEKNDLKGSEIVFFTDK